ncbi:hypothetical protein CHKEEEPN_1638 [Methylorubrum podarium]|nr:hypothetical protein CHKEEEPN_1638 [Methylorubrum podarium]
MVVVFPSVEVTDFDSVVVSVDGVDAAVAGLVVTVAPSETANHFVESAKFVVPAPRSSFADAPI